MTSQQETPKREGELLETMRSLADLAEHGSFVAAAVPADERSMVALGTQFIRIMEEARAAILRATGGA